MAFFTIGIDHLPHHFDHALFHRVIVMLVQQPGNVLDRDQPVGIGLGLFQQGIEFTLRKLELLLEQLPKTPLLARFDDKVGAYYLDQQHRGGDAQGVFHVLGTGLCDGNRQEFKQDSLHGRSLIAKGNRFMQNLFLRINKIKLL